MTYFFQFYGVKGCHCTAVIIIVTMGSYGALVCFINSLQTRMYLFFVSFEIVSMHHNRYVISKDMFATSNSDRIKIY